MIVIAVIIPKLTSVSLLWYYTSVSCELENFDKRVVAKTKQAIIMKSKVHEMILR